MKLGKRSFLGAGLILRLPRLPLHMRGPIVELSDLRTAVSRRRKGDATALMLRTTTEADVARVILFLAVAPGFGDGPDAAQLEAFYGRHGFVAIQAEPLLMVRPHVGMTVA